MGRPKGFPAVFQDLIAKYKSRAVAEKNYKLYMLLAKEQGLDENARLSDIQGKPQEQTEKRVTEKRVTERPTKKQRMTDKHSPAAAGVSSGEKELYERLVEAERLRAEAEKQRGDDLSKIAMMLASGKKEDLVIPPSPAVDEEPAAGDGNIEATPMSNTHHEEHTKQKHGKLMTLAGGIF